MNPVINRELINRKGRIKENLPFLQSWCASIKHLMFQSPPNYAKGRLELHLRHFVSLEKKCSKNGTEVKRIKLDMYAGASRIEALGEILLPEFHQGLVFFYPRGTRIEVHRDSSVYEKGAAQVNVRGRASFLISGNQNTNDLQKYWLEEGDCIEFDNKQPHGIETVTEDRWCICFFKLKPEYLGIKPQEDTNHKQLSLL